MRIGTKDPVWLVTNPSPHSALGDILSETTLGDLELQFKGGLTAADAPTLYTDRGDAERDARGRLIAFRAARVLLERVADGDVPTEPRRVALLDGDGNVVLEAGIG